MASVSTLARSNGATKPLKVVKASIISYQLSVISYQLSVISYLSICSHRKKFMHSRPFVNKY
ncbi:MAG: hypothetical protein DRR16_04495 [Candidatus Parabeggiatoa sp. nov. 3]|nr:MAG: hypothetical protein DRR00_21860 [Gammaproteobacteria bacterium]RKZ64745.1 MAG: hypothetical protein DRQ99_14770 [Gammaproteobacteria bacterium]RKZ88620.1 MAG: hypothetical protein DRR16_04495 [Gammaproteobacteria bacterium]